MHPKLKLAHAIYLVYPTTTEYKNFLLLHELQSHSNKLVN